MAVDRPSDAGIEFQNDDVKGFSPIGDSPATKIPKQVAHTNTPAHDPSENDHVTLQEDGLENGQLSAILEQYQRALEDLQTFTFEKCSENQLNLGNDTNIGKLYERLKTKIESPAFLEKLESIHESNLVKVPLTEDQGSWDVITENDLLSGEPKDARNCLDQESYILVNQEDILEGMACFMARYLSSIPQAKDMTPKQLQNVLRKAFGISKKGRIRRWWDGSKAFYAAASWGATAVSLYNNPAFISAASAAFWTSCRVITKFM